MNKISLKLAKKVADKLEIKFDKFSLKQFCYGMNVETEHGSKDKKTQIVKNDNPMIFGKIALAHLNEFPDYYIRLNRMEKQAKKDQKILKENPDKINLKYIRQDKRDREIIWFDNDTYTFGYFDNRLYIESGGIKHSDLKNEMGQFGRDDLKHAGRFWLKNHVISFWNPINTQDLKKLIRDIYKEVQVKIENDWYIEYDYNKFKTIGEFTGETTKSKDINSDHTVPPMYKIKKPIRGFGSDKYNKLAATNKYNSVAQMNYYNKNKYANEEYKITKKVLLEIIRKFIK